MKTKLKMTQEEPSREVTGSPGAPRDCPFCEQDTVVGVEVVETPGVHYACCLNCAARGPLSGTAGLAIEAWNERYAASKLLAEASGSDQQGNRASQEPPVAGVRVWVLAEERLPPPGVEVLVYGPMNLMRWGIDVVKNEGEFFYSSFPNEVSHWMPLPDPPAAPQQEQTP